ncbi:hypothetical protein [Chromobacterium phragmitis]
MLVTIAVAVLLLAISTR